MRWGAVVLALIVGLASITSGATCVRASGSVDGAAEIERGVRAYMEAIDAGDLDRQMGFWSADSAASSAIMGESWTGRARIRARSAEYVPVSKLMRNELGAVTVSLLARDVALALVPYRPLRRDPANEKLGRSGRQNEWARFRRASGARNAPAALRKHLRVEAPRVLDQRCELPIAARVRET